MKVKICILKKLLPYLWDSQNKLSVLRNCILVISRKNFPPVLFREQYQLGLIGLSTYEYICCSCLHGTQSISVAVAVLLRRSDKWLYHWHLLKDVLHFLAIFDFPKKISFPSSPIKKRTFYLPSYLKILKHKFDF